MIPNLFMFMKKEMIANRCLFCMNRLNAEIKKCGVWTIGDIYSTLEHGKEYSEQELIKMIKEGKVISKY